MRFWDKDMTELIWFPHSGAIFSVMFHRLKWTTFFYYILSIRLYYVFLSQLISHFDTAFFNFAGFRKLQIANGDTKYYETVPAQSKTPRDTTCKISNRYIAFKYRFSLEEKIRLFWIRVYTLKMSLSIFLYQNYKHTYKRYCQCINHWEMCCVSIEFWSQGVYKDVHLTYILVFIRM